MAAALVAAAPPQPASCVPFGAPRPLSGEETELFGRFAFRAIRGGPEAMREAAAEACGGAALALASLALALGAWRLWRRRHASAVRARGVKLTLLLG
jgi:hypothetical protein